MPDREGSAPTDEKPVNTPAEEAPNAAEPEESTHPTEDAPPQASLEDRDPLDIASVADDETQVDDGPKGDDEDEAKAEAEGEEVGEGEDPEPDPELEEEEPEPDPDPDPAPEKQEHLHNLPPEIWKKMPQDGRDAYLKFRKNAETTLSHVNAYNQHLANLGLKAEDALAAMDLMAGIKKGPDTAKEALAKYAPDLVQPEPAPAPQALDSELIKRLEQATEEVDIEALDAVLKDIKEASKAPAPKPEAKPEPKPEPKATEKPDAAEAEAQRIWDNLQAATGIEDEQELVAHLNVLGPRVVKSLGRTPTEGEMERALLKEHRLYLAEQSAKAQKRPSAKPIRARSPRAVPKAAASSDEPIDPLDIAWGHEGT